MKAAILEALGVENLKLKDIPVPQPGPNDVLVRLRAASLNFRDLVIADGGYGSAQRTENLIPLSDGAGEIAEVGSEVKIWQPGDRVVGAAFPLWRAGRPTEARLRAGTGSRLDGTAVEYRVYPATAVLPIPPHLNFVEAATLPCAALTAWSAVVTHGRVGPGQSVITQGSGGVSVFALQFAKLSGVRITALSSTDEKLGRLQALGASHLVNYTDKPEWGDYAKHLSGDSGADLVVEIGGAGTLKQSLRAVRVGGTISLIGVVAGGRVELNLGPIVTRQIQLQAITCGNTEQFFDMLAAIAQHELRPVVDKVFPLAELPAAYAHLKSGQHFGKVCVEI
jgi:NADPH:quinone reductase-like Zn-dependent oxidoreductase